MNCPKCSDEGELLSSESPVTQLRQEVAGLKAELAKLKKPFTVTVEIPEPNQGGTCSHFCPLMIYHIKDGDMRCDKNLHIYKLGYSYPGPDCPRYEGE